MKTQTVTASYRNTAAKITLHVIESGDLTEGQATKAESFAATHYFTTGDVMTLPKYQHAALTEAGWIYTKIGHTSYASTTWGAKKL
jgi:hypothetical protein